MPGWLELQKILDDPRPAVDTWELRTAKGKPVLTVRTVGGERTYKRGDWVTQEDFHFQFSGKAARKFRGIVATVSAGWNAELKMATHVYWIDITQHDMIDSGEYKPRKVVKSSPDAPPCGAVQVPAPGPALGTSLGFSPSKIEPVKPAGPGARQFDFSEED
jgi:hypothetical protein